MVRVGSVAVDLVHQSKMLMAICSRTTPHDGSVLFVTHLHTALSTVYLMHKPTTIAFGLAYFSKVSY